MGVSSEIQPSADASWWACPGLRLQTRTKREDELTHEAFFVNLNFFYMVNIVTETKVRPGSLK